MADLKMMDKRRPSAYVDSFWPCRVSWTLLNNVVLARKAALGAVSEEFDVKIIAELGTHESRRSQI